MAEPDEVTEQPSAAYTLGRDCSRCGSTPDAFGYCRCEEGPKIEVLPSASVCAPVYDKATGDLLGYA